MLMTAALVHIGYHKTGTTWFQEQFYPRVHGASYVARKLVRSSIIEPRAFSFSPETARQSILEVTGDRRPLLCEENLSGYVHNGGLGGLLSKEIAGRIRAVFPDARIIVFLRSQPKMVRAAYAQYVLAGGTESLSAYVGWERKKGVGKYWYKAPAFAFEQLQYQPLLDHYAGLFGKEAVQVYLFEEFAADPRRFAKRFAAEQGLDVDCDQLEYTPVNKSLTPRQLRILARLNLLTARSVGNKRWIADRRHWYDRRWTWLWRVERYCGRWYSDEPLLTPAQDALIAATFAASNAELERSWALPLSAHGYPLPK